MKVVVITHDADFTGAPRMAFDIANDLQRDHEVTVLSKRDGPLIELPKYGGLKGSYKVTETSHLGGHIPFNERVRRAVKVLDEIKPGLVYANSCGSAEWCVAAHRMGIPSVLHTHEMLQGLMSLSAADVLKFDIPKYVDLLVSASREATDDFLKATTGSARRYFEFGVAIDIDYVREMASADVALPTNCSGRILDRDKTVVAMCGMATARKGFDIFYDAAKALPQAEFLWVGPLTGDGVGKSVMKAYRAECLDNFFVTNETPNPYAYMNLCDVFALTAVEDPNPLVVPEALALGKRVVSFQATGGSWRWTRRFGYSLSGSISTQRLVAFLQKMLATKGGRSWTPQEADDFRAGVDTGAKMPMLRQQLSELVGAPV
jgi:glycosyltransferase involved in cell wall biosynthesis